MTKRILAGLTAVLAIVAIYFFVKKDHAPAVVLKPAAPATMATPVQDSPILVQTTNSGRTPASTGYANAPSKEWESLLTENLKKQSGDSLKDIKIVKEKSMIWNRDDVPLHVQSVVVTLTNKAEVQSSFRAVVDSQTGKVLETWDQSIFDPANVKEGFRFKLDPRYSN